MAGLTRKQETFAQEYVRTGNGSDAYRAAYAVRTMSDKSVWEQASKHLRHPKIAARIAELMAPAVEAAQIGARDVVRELASIGFASIADVVSWDDQGVHLKASDTLPPEVLAAVAVVKVKRRRLWKGQGEDAESWELDETEVKMHDKVAALDKLARATAAYAAEKHEHTGPRGGPIPIQGDVKHGFDHDAYARLFGELVAGSQPGAAAGDGALEPVDPADPHT